MLNQVAQEMMTIDHLRRREKKDKHAFLLCVNVVLGLLAVTQFCNLNMFGWLLALWNLFLSLFVASFQPRKL
jgi:hypothetical protein